MFGRRRSEDNPRVGGPPRHYDPFEELMIGSIVHYAIEVPHPSYDVNTHIPGREIPQIKVCRAAIVTEITNFRTGKVGLHIFPTVNEGRTLPPQDATRILNVWAEYLSPDAGKIAGTWHWPHTK